jgi:hypothetical protein
VVENDLVVLKANNMIELMTALAVIQLTNQQSNIKIKALHQIQRMVS